MIKTYAAMAVLFAVSGTAMAQSTVQIYGLLDLGVTRTNSGNSISNGFGNPSQWNEQAGNQSRLGFRGQEDLGGGSYARFDLQSRFAMNTGSASNPFFQARSIVALGNSRYGEVYLGREYAPELWVAIAVDPTAYSYVSQLGNYTTAGYNSGYSTETYFRHDNSVGYKSPTISGLSTELAVSAGEGQRKSIEGFNIQYKASPIYAGVAYDGSNASNRMWVTTAGYDFGFVKTTIGYANAKGGLNSQFPLGAKSYSVGIVVPVRELNRVYFQGSRLTTVGVNHDSTKLGMGYEHYLSKRTWLYTNVGTATTDGNLSATVPYKRKTAVDAGMVHSF